jgi:hypothetical protein
MPGHSKQTEKASPEQPPRSWYRHRSDVNYRQTVSATDIKNKIKAFNWSAGIEIQGINMQDWRP